MRYQSRSFVIMGALAGFGFMIASGIGSASSVGRSGTVADETRYVSDLSPSRQRGDASFVTMPVGANGGCVDGPDLDWFTTPRPLPACFTIRSMHYKDAEDINRDGEAEFIDYVGGVVLSIAGTAQPGGCVAYITQTHWDGEEVVLTRHCVASSESVAAYTAQRFPNQTVTTYFDSGLRDIDKDGDLDLVLMLDMEAPPHYPYYVWLENTGYEASNGLAADINRDGVVDGKDLASVLSAWTP
jgi:hypothetical protein